MSEKNNYTLDIERKKTDPQIEDAIHELLSGETKKHALDFVTYLREIEMPPDDLPEGNVWTVSYKGAEGVCHILINGAAQYPGPWTIWPDSEYDGAPEYIMVDENLKKTAWEYIKTCSNCGGCGPGKRKTILGKEFDNVCNAAMEFTDPDAEALDCIKNLMILRRNVINDSHTV
jgi:hypothetical protein